MCVHRSQQNHLQMLSPYVLTNSCFKCVPNFNNKDRCLWVLQYKRWVLHLQYKHTHAHMITYTIYKKALVYWRDGQWTKVLATKSDSLNLISGTHVAKGEN